MVAVGLMLLIVPGIYLGLKYQFYGYAIADKGIGPIDALKESDRMTEGAKQNLLIFWLTLYCGIIVVTSSPPLKGQGFLLHRSGLL